MLAATIVDGALEVTERPDPAPAAGEARIRIKAAGLNNADLLQVRGLYPAPPGSPPDIPGLELAGIVDEVGPGVSRVAPGDRVMAVVGGGGHAELACVHESHLVPVPDALSWEVAGGVPEAFTTAHDALFSQCGLSLGERVAISGAAGGVGTAGVQLAVAAGALVTATVRTEARRADVAELGARAIAPEELVDHGPYDVVLELIGAPNLPDDLRALALGGRIVVIGVGAGAKAEVDLLAVMGKRARICGSTLRTRPIEGKAMAARGLERHVVPLLAAGTIGVPVAATFPLTEAPAAYERFAEGGKLGKIVLLMDGS